MFQGPRLEQNFAERSVTRCSCQVQGLTAQLNPQRLFTQLAGSSFRKEGVRSSGWWLLELRTRQSVPQSALVP